MKKRIWFNRWFSTAYHFMEAINNNPDGFEFEIYGTHPIKDTVYFEICDYYEVEPVLEGAEYIEYCLDFCRRHLIDVFVPYHYALEISEDLARFTEIGTRVLVCEDFGLMDTMSHKGKLYESFQENDLSSFVPDYRIVRNAGEFQEAYRMIMNKGKKVCFKPANGRGGAGFRVVTESESTVEDLFGPISHEITYSNALKILSSVSSFEELMVLEYLEDAEYSIDCLAYNGQLLAAVPRKKVSGRIRKLEAVPELLELANRVNSIYQIPYVYNIQVKYSQGIPKLLEINPRMSGGLHISCLSGVNFPYLAVKLLLAGFADVPFPKLGIAATHIEQSVMLSKEERLVVK
ncbi:carbamoyl-phosphate synthase large subunit [Peribacillus saganii]|uniref:Carbamoyl-phosphate synthase large subunit n=1 Tax=Peribacillus saganii TaxID=2303992 RepID=A0A372LQG7_9BACI|nr:ATP-grasp domain-containing protein [Peribacillus saganii]RFU69039.1 carbamoyl-phosphate synthase large subunit [Peribacillus saganii]